MEDLESFKIISCEDLKYKSIEEKIKYIKLYSNDNILITLPIDWMANFFVLLKSIDPTDFDIAGMYDNSLIFNDSMELLNVKVACSIELEEIMKNIAIKYIALMSSLNDYNQEMAEHLDNFYWNYFLTASNSDISYVFNLLLYSQKQGQEGNNSRIIDMNNVKHVRNAKYLFNCIQKNSKNSK